MRLRTARVAEAGALTALTRRSKAYWGYDQEFLARLHDLLVIRPEDIRDDDVVVAERDGALLGYYRLGGQPPHGELNDLFVDPDAIGTGVGRALWRHALGAARGRGWVDLVLESDPHAEAFYLRMGAERAGEREVAPDRFLPLMWACCTDAPP